MLLPNLKARILDQLAVWGVPLLCMCLAAPVLRHFLIPSASPKGRCEMRRDRIGDDLARAESGLASARASLAAGDQGHQDPQYYQKAVPSEEARVKVLLEELARPCP